MKAEKKPTLHPEDWLDPATFPPELQWVPAHYKLHPTDPVYLLLAWHWHRIEQTEDTIHAAMMELRTALDHRIATVTAAAETLTGLSESIAAMQLALEEKPVELVGEIDRALNQPLDQAVGRLQALEKSVAPLARNFQVSQRRQLLAALLTGVALGVLCALIVVLA